MNILNFFLNFYLQKIISLFDHPDIAQKEVTFEEKHRVSTESCRRIYYIDLADDQSDSGSDSDIGNEPLRKKIKKSNVIESPKKEKKDYIAR